MFQSTVCVRISASNGSAGGLHSFHVSRSAASPQPRSVGATLGPDGPWAYDRRVDIPSGRRLLLLSLVASLCATAAIAIGTLLFGDFGDTEGKILATTAFVALYSLLALPAGILLDGRRLLPLAWTTLALAAVDFVLVQVLLWGAPDQETLGRIALTLGAYLVGCTQTSASASRLGPRDSTSVRALFAASTALVLVLATMVSVAVWAEVDRETYWRLLASLAVANVLLTVLQPVLRRMQGPDRLPPHRLGLTLSGGGEREVEVQARDFADAVARAVRDAERDGATVERIERIPLP